MQRQLSVDILILRINDGDFRVCQLRCARLYAGELEQFFCFALPSDFVCHPTVSGDIAG